MFDCIKLVKKDKCKTCPDSIFVQTLEGRVCTGCGIVYQKYDIDYTTFEQKSHYDIIPSNSEELNKFSYIITPFLFSIPPFDLVDLSVQNSLISQCIEIIENLIKDEVIGKNIDKEVCACLSLIVVLGKEGVSLFEVFEVFKRDNTFERHVMFLYRQIDRKYKDLIYVDKEHEKFSNRVLNLLEISFQTRKKILPIFKKSMKEVWFDGTHVKIVLAVCILYFTEGEEKESAYYYFIDKWKLSEQILNNKREILQNRLNNLPSRLGT